MKILHFADLHIGVENYGQPDPQTGLSTRLKDFLYTFDSLVSFAIEKEVDLVLFCGDAYKSRDPSQTHQREFAKRINELARANIPVFLLVGNHDLPHTLGKASALEIFPTLQVPNVHVGERLQTFTVQTKNGPIQIVAVPWIRKGPFLAREETRGLTAEQINESIQQRLTEAIKMEADSLDPTIPAILAAHVSLDRATTSSEQSMMLGKDHVLFYSNVALPVFEYVALGHIHKHQIIGQKPMAVYSGSLQRIDFGEEKDTKGFCIIEINSEDQQGERLKNFEFIPVDARRLVTIKVEVTNSDKDPTNKVLKAINKYSIEDAIVRVQIKVNEEMETFIRESEIYQAVKSAHYVASVSKEIIRETRTRLGEDYSEGITPEQAIKAYFNSKNISGDRAKILMEYANQLMIEED